MQIKSSDVIYPSGFDVFILYVCGTIIVFQSELLEITVKN